jgi:hypothetical protein
MSVRARESGHPVFTLGPRVRGDERSFTETARSKTSPLPYDSLTGSIRNQKVSGNPANIAVCVRHA